MNNFQQILEDPNILRTTSSCTHNYSGDSFDMHNFKISLLGGRGDPLTYCQFTSSKKTKRSSQSQMYHPNCHWLFHQFFVPRLAWWHAWHDPEWGSPVFYREKIFVKHGNVSTPPNKKRWILNEFWGSNLFPNKIIPGSTADLQCRWLDKVLRTN